MSSSHYTQEEANWESLNSLGPQYTYEYAQERAFGRELTNLQSEHDNLRLPRRSLQKSSSNYLPKTLTLHANNLQQHGNEVHNQLQIPVVNNSSQVYGNSNEGQHNNCQLDQAAEKELQRLADEDSRIPEYVSQYSRKIFDYLRENENKYLINNYMTEQADINEKMRAILIDWLIDVHLKYKMVAETLFLTVYLIDKYLECNQVSRQRLQLVGIAALFLASKYEEIYPPQLRDFIEVTDRSYSKYELLEMESKIVGALNFSLTVPSTLRFLERYARLLTSDQRVYFLARYLIELALLEYRFVTCAPSNLAASAVYLSMKIYKKRECWSHALAAHSKYRETEVRPIAKELCLLLQGAQQSKLQALRRKFSTAQYLEISKITLDKAQQQQQQQQQQQ